MALTVRFCFKMGFIDDKKSRDARYRYIQADTIIDNYLTLMANTDKISDTFFRRNRG